MVDLSHVILWFRLLEFEFFSYMRNSDLQLLLSEIRGAYPIEFARLSERYSERVVVFEMIARHPRHLNRIVWELFTRSEEYACACLEISELMRTDDTWIDFVER